MRNTLILLGTMSCIFWVALVSAQQAEQDSTRIAPFDHVEQLFNQTSHWRELPVREILIDTPFPYDHKRIKRLLDIESGQTLTPDLVRSNIERLYLSEFFENISVSGSLKDNGVAVTFRCVKAYIIDSLLIRGGYTRLPWLGATQIAQNDIRERITLQKGGTFTNQKEKETVNIIKKMFRDDGYWNCDVQVNSHFDNKNRTVRVEIVINRGKAARIKDYNIKQQRVDIDTFNISKVYRINKWKLNRFRQDQFEQDLKKTEEYYRRFGYYQSRCAIDRIEYNPETADIIMDLSIDPGPMIQLEFEYKRHLWNWYWYLPWINRQSIIGSVLDFAPVDLLPVIKRGEAGQRSLEKGCENIELLYKNKGYENVEVKVSSETIADKRGNRIVYQIVEGEKVWVNRIKISGANFFKPKQIKRAMRIKEYRRPPLSYLQTITSKVIDQLNGVFVSEVFEKDIQNIRSLYMTNGFRNCVVTGSPELRKDMSVDLSINIDEGIQTIISELEFIGNAAIDTKQLYQTVVIKQGDPFFPALIEQSRINLLLLYESIGYLSNTQIESIAIEPEITFADYGHLARIAFKITEGYQIWFDRPLIKGIISTKNDVISREIQFKKFEPYSLSKVLQTREKLYKLGFFKQVSFQEVAMKHPYYSRTVVYTLQEKNSGSFDFGGGWNTLEGWKLFGTIADKNLLNNGQYLGVRVSVNQDYTDNNVELFFREPYLGNIPLELNTSMYRQYKDKDEYELYSSGGRLSVSRVFRFFYRTTLEYRLENIKGGLNLTISKSELSERMEHDERLEYIEEFPRRISSITPRFSIDTRDNPFLPMKGYLGNIQIEFARDILGSKTDFTKMTFSGSYYLPINRQSVLVTGINLGLADDLPIFERYRLGGPTTMRGFGLDRIGPKSNQDHSLFGNTMGLLNLEYRFPLIWGFGAQIFYDTGNVWLETIDEIDTFSLEQCFGWGIRFDLPFGPLRVDCGYEIHENQTIGQPEWSFSIGHPF
ncbi:outer membrane protein assembly factor BamA [bacterium]|nr:outer membrane protein assembly factor BamA [bacterium]